METDKIKELYSRIESARRNNVLSRDVEVFHTSFDRTFYSGRISAFDFVLELLDDLFEDHED